MQVQCAVLCILGAVYRLCCGCIVHCAVLCRCSAVHRVVCCRCTWQCCVVGALKRVDLIPLTVELTSRCRADVLWGALSVKKSRLCRRAAFYYQVANVVTNSANVAWSPPSTVWSSCHHMPVRAVARQAVLLAVCLTPSVRARPVFVSLFRRRSAARSPSCRAAVANTSFPGSFCPWTVCHFIWLLVLYGCH